MAATPSVLLLALALVLLLMLNLTTIHAGTDAVIAPTIAIPMTISATAMTRA